MKAFCTLVFVCTSLTAFACDTAVISATTEQQASIVEPASPTEPLSLPSALPTDRDLAADKDGTETMTAEAPIASVPAAEPESLAVAALPSEPPLNEPLDADHADRNDITGSIAPSASDDLSVPNSATIIEDENNALSADQDALAGALSEPEEGDDLDLGIPQGAAASNDLANLDPDEAAYIDPMPTDQAAVAEQEDSAAATVQQTVDIAPAQVMEFTPVPIVSGE